MRNFFSWIAVYLIYGKRPIGRDASNLTEADGVPEADKVRLKTDHACSRYRHRAKLCANDISLYSRAAPAVLEASSKTAFRDPRAAAVTPR